MGIKKWLRTTPVASDAESKELQLLPSEHSQAWQEIENFRLQFDGPYQFARLRGGLDSKQTLDGSILSSFSFSATVGGTRTDYMAVHTNTGSVYLLNKATHLDPASPTAVTKIFDAVFTTSNQIKMTNAGFFLYLFDYDSDLQKVYDCETGVATDWLGSVSGAIQTYNWHTFRDWRNPNVWGISEGKQMIMWNSWDGGEYVVPGGGTDKSNRSFVSTIEDVKETLFTYSDPEGTLWASTDNDMVGGAPFNTDLEPWVGINSSVIYDNATSASTVNTDFTTPIMYRGYCIVDVLTDGSVLLPGRPITVATSVFQAIDQRRTSIEFSVVPAGGNVEKRLLFATRWQLSEDNVFQPSTQNYPNGTFFFAKEIEQSQASFVDETRDELLINPMSGYFQMIAGSYGIFGKGQLTPYSISSVQNSLLLGGYKINRPVPELIDTINVDDGNAFIQVGSGTALADNPTVKVIFEYTDGKKSNPVEYATVLTDASDTLDPGGSGQKASVDVRVTSAPTAGGTFTVADKDDGTDNDSFNYTGATPITTLASNIVNAINNLAIAVSATQAGAGDVVRITADSIGLAGNLLGITFTYADNIALDGDASGTYTATLSGGADATDPITVSGNTLLLHSINSLVTSIFIVIEDTTGQYLFATINSNDPKFYGATIYLPNSAGEIDALPSFIMPSGTDIRETADLYDHMVAGAPFQQLRISEQAKIRDSVPIRQIVATQFDVDKTAMRKRVVIFTDRNIQIGYLIFGSGGVEYDFEVINEGPVLSYRLGAYFIEGGVVYQANDGIYRLTSQGNQKLVDRDRYSFLSNNMTGALYNRRHEEYWMMFGSTEVLIVKPGEQGRCRFLYGESVPSGNYVGETLVLCTGSSVHLADLDSTTDNGTAITGTLISEHMNNPKIKTKIHEVAVAGEGASASVALDLQEERLERTTGTWQKQFQNDVEVTGKTLYMHGTPFTFYHRAVMPRVRVQMSGDNDAFISHIIATISVSENKSVAR